ncbi:MAG: UPF0280 family protein [Candidatus Ratteibacteria bacterium]|nr:UPF0280 family protein [Candidatus Ratteibacteria bacterium]
MYVEKNYRGSVKEEDLVNFTVREKETDLLISADKDLRRIARQAILDGRKILEDYIKYHPDFSITLAPYHPEPKAPALIQEMAEAAGLAGVGPMAAVAGLFAQKAGEALLPFSSQVLVENGGDVFITTKKKRRIGIYTENGNFGDKLALEVSPEDSPLGICTSSGKLGHSLSFGKADAVVVLSHQASLADAAATAIGNRVKNIKDISLALAWGKTISGIMGILIMIDKKIAVWGRMNLVV